MITSSGVLRLSGLVLMIAIAPGLALAQKRVESFGDLNKVLKVGQGVAVIDNSGRRTTGKVEQILTSSLVVRLKEAKGTRTQAFTESDVSQISRTAPIWDGAVKGLVVAMLATAAITRGCNGCGDLYSVAGVAGAGIGLGIDAAFKPPTVYVSSPQKRKVQLTLLFTKDEKGLLAVIHF